MAEGLQSWDTRYRVLSYFTGIAKRQAAQRQKGVYVMWREALQLL